MKYPSVASLLALCAASRVLAFDMYQAAAAAHVEELVQRDADAPQPALEQRSEQELENLKPRGVAAGGGAALGTTLSVAATQYPSVTTQWVESTIAGTTTYVEVIYTQTFAAVPDQWPSPGQGVIGYGTLTAAGAATTTTAAKAKRWLEARETGLGIAVEGYAQPVVLAMPSEIITQYLQPVEEVVVLRTFTIMANMSDATSSNDTAVFPPLALPYPGSSNGTSYNGTSYNSTTLANTTSPFWNVTAPAYSMNSTSYPGTGVSPSSFSAPTPVSVSTTLFQMQNGTGAFPAIMDPAAEVVSTTSGGT